MKIKPTYVIATALIIVSLILAYDAFSSYVSPYLSVSEIVINNSSYSSRDIQVLGKVANGSSTWAQDGSFLFGLTDGQYTVSVTSRSSVPQNFQENQDVVVVGRLLSPGSLNASEILVKCPSKYEGGNTSLFNDPIFLIAIILGAVTLVYYVAFVLLKKG